MRPGPVGTSADGIPCPVRSSRPGDRAALDSATGPGHHRRRAPWVPRRGAAPRGDPGGAARHLRDRAPGRGRRGRLRLARRDPRFTPSRSAVISASLQAPARSRPAPAGSGSAPRSGPPLNHPLRIAEEAATVDHISEGRFEFGIGRSGVVRTYDTYGVPYVESQARFREALDILRRAWTGEPFSHQGEFYRVDNATVAPRPYQVPHPLIRMAATATTRRSRRGAARPADLHRPALDRDSDLRPSSALPRRLAEAGHPGRREVYADPGLRPPTEDGAREGASRAQLVLRPPDRVARQAVGRATGPADRRQMQAERMAALSYDVIERKGAPAPPARRRAPDRPARASARRGGGRAERGADPAGPRARSPRVLTRDVIPALKARGSIA